MGSVTIAQALGVPFPVVAAAVVAMAIGCFVGAEKLERIFAPKAGKTVPVSEPARPQPAVRGPRHDRGPRPRHGRAPRAAGAGDGEDRREDRSRRARAEDRRGPAVALDPRPARPEGGRRRRGSPGRVTLPEATPPAKLAATLPATRTLVAYAQGDVAALPAGLDAFPGEVLVLAGGYDAWKRIRPRGAAAARRSRHPR